MTDPLFDSSSHEAKILAEARRGFSPQDGDLERVFGRIRGVFDTPDGNYDEPLLPSLGPPAPATGAARLFSLKTLLASSAVSLLVGLGVGFGASQLNQPRVALVPPPPQQLEHDSAQKLVEPESKLEVHQPEAAKSPSFPPVSQTRRSLVKELSAQASQPKVAPYDELTAVRNAQSALKAGDAMRALGLMRDLRARTKGGGLQAERGVIEVLALCALARAPEAQRLAESLLKQNPDFAYASRLRGSCALQSQIPSP